MKLKQYIIFGTLALVLIISSCKSWVDTDLNDDPNNPTDVTMDMLISSSQGGMAYVMGGYASYFAGVFTQQLSGGEGQVRDWDKYSVSNTAGDRIWNQSYAGWLADLKIVIQKAEEQEAPHYKGVAQILTAISLGNLTDLFGDIPWSEALQGAENFKAKFDSQQDIYTAIFNLLDEGIANLKEDAGLFPLGSADLMYGGSAESWIAAANSLKARYTLHKSKVENGSYQAVLDIIAAGPVISDNSGDMEVVFGTESTENAPIYRMHQDRINYLIMGEKYVDMMLETSDPRLPMVAGTYNKDDASYSGGEAGQADTKSSLAGGEMYGAPDAPVHFMTYVELKFIEAECYFQTNKKAEAASAYNEAVKASLAKMGVSNASWETTYASESSSSISLETIINGKYLALFNQIEVWTDWRRTGYPSVTIPSNAKLKETPRRLPYPDDEVTYNDENVPDLNSTQMLTDRMWWDN